jgi:hypothetical protein
VAKYRIEYSRYQLSKPYVASRLRDAFSAAIRDYQKLPVEKQQDLGHITGVYHRVSAIGKETREVCTDDRIVEMLKKNFEDHGKSVFETMERLPMIESEPAKFRIDYRDNVVIRTLDWIGLVAGDLYRKVVKKNG